MNTINEPIQLINSNPLLEGLVIERTRTEWSQLLSRNPLERVDQSVLSEFEFRLMAGRLRDAFVATDQVCEIAAAVHQMLIEGLLERHPHYEAAKRAQYLIAREATQPSDDFPHLTTNPRGMILESITKQGKTKLLERILHSYPQVIPRGSDSAAGWRALKQLVYLVVPMPTDPSKAGFLLSAFKALDAALGTDYAERARIRNSTVEMQLVQMLGVLVAHRCGLLVIEETQEQNQIGTARFGSEWLTFFLRVLNCGIPTVIVGNPLAFRGMDQHLQVSSRLCEAGRFSLHPTWHWTAQEWERDLVPGIWLPSLFNQPDEPIDGLENMLWEVTGGFKHLLAALRTQALIAARLRGARRVERCDIESASRHQSIARNRDLVQAFVQRDASKLSGVKDFPLKLYSAKFRLEKEYLAKRDAEPKGKPGPGGEEADGVKL
jgi:hypothetical protein